MNQIEQDFKDNIDIAIDQLSKGIIDEFKTSVIPLPWICTILEVKYQYQIDRPYIDLDYNYVFRYKNKKGKIYLSGCFIQGPVIITYKDASKN